MTTLRPSELVDALALDVPHELLPDPIEGTPSAGSVTLDERNGVEVGVWEMTTGTAADTEIDETFVVLAGAATVRFQEVPGLSAPPADLALSPGSVVRLAAGTRSVWTVTETLRKIYIAT